MWSGAAKDLEGLDGIFFVRNENTGRLKYVVEVEVQSFWRIDSWNHQLV
jgi:hypothetical protein